MLASKNVIGLMIFLMCGSLSAQDYFGADPSVPGVTIDDALRAVKELPEAEITTAPNGWITAIEKDRLVRWLFTPIGHPATPALIRQTLRPGQNTVDLTVKCQGNHRDCLRLIDEFKIENERLKARMPARFD